MLQWERFAEKEGFKPTITVISQYSHTAYHVSKNNFKKAKPPPVAL